ncbi:hypothetical protein JCM10003_225 [Bacteroides pyogenes JCM 10003]|nr:hypothetical protein JCM10003_225 [Bacteroides pyogenes JCM 10003]
MPSLNSLRVANSLSCSLIRFKNRPQTASNSFFAGSLVSAYHNRVNQPSLSETATNDFALTKSKNKKSDI